MEILPEMYIFEQGENWLNFGILHLDPDPDPGIFPKDF